MGSDDRSVTKTIPCDCGKGKYEFYTCQNDGWSFVHHPDDEWYEMHIWCDECVTKYSAFKPYKRFMNGWERWVLKIEKPETPPALPTQTA